MGTPTPTFAPAALQEVTSEEKILDVVREKLSSEVGVDGWDFLLMKY